MIGNAVPVRLGHALAKRIFDDLSQLKSLKKPNIINQTPSLNGVIVKERMFKLINTV
jgi:hypothetical protein